MRNLGKAVASAAKVCLNSQLEELRHGKTEVQGSSPGHDSIPFPNTARKLYITPAASDR